MIRKMRRDYLRKQVGNKNLKFAWKRYQMKKYKKLYKYICIYPQLGIRPGY